MKMYGKEVVDATRKRAVTLTADDVENAVPTDPAHCPIALGLRRDTGVQDVSVGADMVYITMAAQPDVLVRYALSPNDKALIKAFDEAGAFPCGYKVTLMPPPPSRQIGARRGQAHGTNVRSGNGNNALNRAARRQPTRHVAAPA